MYARALVSAFLFSVAVVAVMGSATDAEARRSPDAAAATERTGNEVVGASIAHPEELRPERDDYTYDGTYGFTLWRPDTEATHDHGGKPAIRVARAPEMKPGDIQKEVRQTISDYPDLSLSRERIRVGEKDIKGVAVGPIPGATPYVEVYAAVGNRVYQIDVYGTGLDAEARELLESIEFSQPERSVGSLDLPKAESSEALYQEGGPGDETLSREEVVPEELSAAAGDTTAPLSTTTYSASYSPSEVPRYGEERIYEGCWRAASRFFLQTQHDAYANASRSDGIPTGFSIVGRPNYWGQYTHGDLGYGRCNSDYYTNDKFAVDYPYNRGDRVYSPFDGGTVVFAGRTRSHRAYGIFVVIRDDNGKYVSLSAHLNGLAPGIQRGARVGKNTVIGYAGNTGSGSVPVGEVHNHQAFYRYPSYRPNGAPYGGASLQTLYYHYAGTAARDGGGVYKLGWQKTSYQKAEGDRISN